MKTIRVGNAAGFWGDNLDAPRLLVESGRLDYLTLEYLAELTLSILAHQRRKNPDRGYVTDFPDVVQSLVPNLQQQSQLAIVTNAGGVNPQGCAKVVAQVLSLAGLPQTPLAIVIGDDIGEQLEAHITAGETFAHFDSGQTLHELPSKVVSANAYLGAAGIVEALSQGARIVITGRIADAALTVGPAIHEFGWAWNDWDRLAMATVAGHLIECGAQVTGGMYSLWTDQFALSDVGYPIAELDETGAVVISKAEGTAGLVSPETVSEQLVYEIGDPAHYLTPDVDADFSSVRLTQCGNDRVAVKGARGHPAPDRYKVSMSYQDGYTASGLLVINGRNAGAKAQACAEIVFSRLKRAGFKLQQTHVECLGAGDSLPGLIQRTAQSQEIVLRIAVHDSRQEAVERFTRELAPLVSSGPPGVTGYTGSRPKPQPVLAYWPTSISRDRVHPQVIVKRAEEWIGE